MIGNPIYISNNEKKSTSDDYVELFHTSIDDDNLLANVSMEDLNTKLLTPEERKELKITKELVSYLNKQLDEYKTEKHNIEDKYLITSNELKKLQQKSHELDFKFNVQH